MTLIPVLSLALKLLMALVMIYYIIFPKRFKGRNLHWTPLKIRLVFGLSLTLFVVGSLVGYYASAGTKLTELEARMRDRLALSSEESKTSQWTTMCTEENVKEALLKNPSFSEASAKTLALGTCVCMYDKLKVLPGMARAVELLKEGKSFVDATDEGFKDSATEFLSLVRDC